MKMLDNVQIIKENDQAKFAVIPFAEYVQLKEMLADPDRLADYLDYLHMQQVKQQNNRRLTLAEVKAQLTLDE
jgi:hypothetical protein